MPRKMNRQIGFADVYGHPTARYEQHGILFDVTGEELPGFEKVKIPEFVAAVASDDLTLQITIDHLTDVNKALKAEVEDLEAEVEELTGKLDTANVEIGRLTKLNAELAKNTPPDKAAKADKTKDAPAAKFDTQVDTQLIAQGV